MDSVFPHYLGMEFDNLAPNLDLLPAELFFATIYFRDALTTFGFMDAAKVDSNVFSVDSNWVSWGQFDLPAYILPLSCYRDTRDKVY